MLRINPAPAPQLACACFLTELDLKTRVKPASSEIQPPCPHAHMCTHVCHINCATLAGTVVTKSEINGRRS